jgi:hypothetical protein
LPALISGSAATTAAATSAATTTVTTTAVASAASFAGSRALRASFRPQQVIEAEGHRHGPVGRRRLGWARGGRTTAVDAATASRSPAWTEELHESMRGASPA